MFCEGYQAVAVVCQFLTQALTINEEVMFAAMEIDCRGL